MKHILDSIATEEKRKRELIRGDAVDKAEQLSESSHHYIIIRYDFSPQSKTEPCLTVKVLAVL